MLVGLLDGVVRPDGEQPAAPGPGVEGTREGVAAESDVGVQEDEYTRRGVRRAVVAGPRLPQPSLGERGRLDHLHELERPGEGRGVILRVVVYDDDARPRRPVGRQVVASLRAGITTVMPS